MDCRVKPGNDSGGAECESALVRRALPGVGLAQHGKNAAFDLRNAFSFDLEICSVGVTVVRIIDEP